MSLLYECINGIIQGGILGSNDDTADGEEIATLCVTKLRGMIMVEGDPNRKYSNTSIWSARLTYQ
jgi:AP-3 complex subunit delta-1